MCLARRAFMDVNLVEALEKGIEAGGAGVKALVLVAPGKAGKALLQELTDKGYLKSDGGKKFDVTEAGWEAWESNGDAVRRERLRSAALGKLLAAVRAKAKGKDSKAKLSPKDLAVCPPPWRAEAFAKKLIEEVAPEVYRLLPAGEDFLDSLRPVSEQLAKRQSQYAAELAALQEEEKKLTDRIASLRERLLPECERLERELGAVAVQAKQELQRTVEEHRRAAAEAMQHLHATAAFALLVQHFRAKVDEATAAAMEKVEVCCKELHGPLTEARATAAPEMEQVPHDLAALQAALSNHVLKTETELARLAREVASRPPEPSRPPAEPSAEASEPDVPSSPAHQSGVRADREIGPGMG